MLIITQLQALQDLYRGCTEARTLKLHYDIKASAHCRDAGKLVETDVTSLGCELTNNSQAKTSSKSNFRLKDFNQGGCKGLLLITLSG